eukprot:gene11087-3153_t
MATDNSILMGPRLPEAHYWPSPPRNRSDTTKVLSASKQANFLFQNQTIQSEPGRDTSQRGYIAQHSSTKDDIAMQNIAIKSRQLNHYNNNDISEKKIEDICFSSPETDSPQSAQSVETTSTIGRYIQRFRHAPPTSRELRAQVNSIQEDFWWLKRSRKANAGTQPNPWVSSISKPRLEDCISSKLNLSPDSTSTFSQPYHQQMQQLESEPAESKVSDVARCTDVPKSPKHPVLVSDTDVPPSLPSITDSEEVDFVVSPQTNKLENRAKRVLNQSTKAIESARKLRESFRSISASKKPPNSFIPQPNTRMNPSASKPTVKMTSTKSRFTGTEENMEPYFIREPTQANGQARHRDSPQFSGKSKQEATPFKNHSNTSDQQLLSSSFDRRHFRSRLMRESTLLFSVDKESKHTSKNNLPSIPSTNGISPAPINHVLPAQALPSWQAWRPTPLRPFPSSAYVSVYAPQNNRDEARNIHEFGLQGTTTIGMGFRNDDTSPNGNGHVTHHQHITCNAETQTSFLCNDGCRNQYDTSDHNQGYIYNHPPEINSRSQQLPVNSSNSRFLTAKDSGSSFVIIDERACEDKITRQLLHRVRTLEDELKSDIKPNTLLTLDGTNLSESSALAQTLL